MKWIIFIISLTVLVAGQLMSWFTPNDMIGMFMAWYQSVWGMSAYFVDEVD